MDPGLPDLVLHHNLSIDKINGRAQEKATKNGRKGSPGGENYIAEHAWE